MLNYVKRCLVRYGRGLPLVWRVIPKIQNDFKFLKGQDIPKIINTRYRFKMHVNLGDFIGRHIYLHGDYEDYVSQVFIKLIAPGGNVVDIGANIGYFSLLSAQLVGAHGQVIAFEASPNIYQQLANNLSLNGVTNVKTYNKAVGDRDCDVEFFEADNSHLGISSIRNLDVVDSKKILVKMVAINDIIDEIPPIDLVKIDVEGAEMMVLSGMELLIERDKPHIIIEVTDAFLKDLGSSQDELLAWFESKNYTLLEIKHDGLKPLTNKMSDQFNALAIPSR
jgi:FkbM family methyltransferase